MNWGTFNVDTRYNIVRRKSSNLFSNSLLFQIIAVKSDLHILYDKGYWFFLPDRSIVDMYVKDPGANCFHMVCAITRLGIF